MKSIETRYNGYLFRSRTEARWAVFFDAIGLKYEYEIEGFSLNHGNYLPDFYLPEQRMWIEVKGIEPTEREWELAKELSAQGQVMIFVGGPRQYRIYMLAEDKGIRVHRDPDLIVPWWRSLGTIIFSYTDRLILVESLLVKDVMCHLRGWQLDQWLYMTESPGDPYNKVLKDSYEKAIYAQFEHGKTPAGPLQI